MIFFFLRLEDRFKSKIIHPQHKDHAFRSKLRFERMALHLKSKGWKFWLTQMQLTPYNKLTFSSKGKHLNDLGIF